MSLAPTQRTALQAVAVVLTMGGLAYASVPFYDWFCRVTGYGGTTGYASSAPAQALDRTIRVRFDGSMERDMPWTFAPMQREIEIPIGETGIAFYEATNTADHPVAGSAAYNVTPYQAGGFFIKIDCFCFERQVLQPGETIQMPVTFYVDPGIVEDRDAKDVHTITLSYTFYETDLPEGAESAALGGTTETAPAARAEQTEG